MLSPSEIINQLIGSTEGQVANILQGAGYFCMVVNRDGMFYPTVNDFNISRIKIHVVNGVVTKAKIG